MRNSYLLFLLSMLAMDLHAQVGIGTGSPNSTLDLRGSFAGIYRSFTTATSLTANDHTVVFTGSSAATATLPDATGCAGRVYCIKNFSASSPVPVLTLATVSSQMVDGVATWILDETNETVMIISDGANWEIFSQDVPVAKTGTTGGSWNEGGNSVTGTKSIGTITNFDLPFITNNSERMRITGAGNVGIGTAVFSANPEALTVYQNNATSFNVISGKGSLNNYLQLNIQNKNNGNGASSDLVATADNGNEVTNFVDMGINSSGYSAAGVLGGSDNAYLYSSAKDFIIGNSVAGKNLKFFTGGTAAANERMRINGTGSVGIGSSAFSAKPEALLVYQNSATSFNVISGKGSLNNYLQLNIQNKNSGNTASSDLVATADNGNEAANYVDMGINSSGYAVGGILGGPDNVYLYSSANDFIIGNSAAAKDLVFFTGGTATTNERFRITSAGSIGIGTSTPNSTFQANGSVSLPVATEAANYTVLATDYTILCNNSAGAITISLPTASGIGGRVYVIKKTSAAGNDAIISASGAETIDGSTTYTISSQYSGIMIQSDGIGWWVLSKN
jgi:hypothetical protein